MTPSRIDNHPDHRPGLLLTLTEPPPAMAAEFNAWYDTEHMAERRMIPGVISARRWVVLPGQTAVVKYAATYELSSADVLTSPNYLRHVGQGFTPWSARCLSACIAFKRWACVGLDAPPRSADANAQALAIITSAQPLELSGVVGVRQFFDAQGGASQGQPAGLPYVCLVECARIAAFDSLTTPAGATISLYQSYES